MISNGALADEPAELARVEVVGSRVPRLDGETALPVQVIRREEIERSGVTTVEELLKLVSANFGGTTEAASTAKSGISGVSIASLRGLGGARTLVMLNGRRIDNYAFRSRFGGAVDLHAIPLAAIERVEVLKDGASALYGSDAIGGVINFITRREFAGVDVFGSFTKTEDGGGDSGRATLTGGTGHLERDGFNAFGVFDVRKAERLRGSDRPFSQMPFGPELSFQNGDVRTWPSSIFFTRPNPSAPGTPWVPKAIIEVIHFNGDSTLTTPSVVLANPFGDVGNPVGPIVGAAGLYSINDDCTGTVQFLDANNVTYAIFVDPPQGHIVWMIQTKPANNVLQGSAKRVW